MSKLRRYFTGLSKFDLAMPPSRRGVRTAVFGGDALRLRALGQKEFSNLTRTLFLRLLAASEHEEYQAQGW